MCQDGLDRSSSPAPGTEGHSLDWPIEGKHSPGLVVRPHGSRNASAATIGSRRLPGHGPTQVHGHQLTAGAYVAVMLERWTRAVIRWRTLVIAVWVAVVIVGVVAAGRLPRLLSTSIAVPDTSSQQADAILTQHFGENIEGTFTVVFRVAKVSGSTLRTMDGQFAAAARSVPTARTMALRPVEGILYANVGTSLDLQQAASHTGALRHAFNRLLFLVAGHEERGQKQQESNNFLD